MLETVIALVFAHVMADFVLQTDAMARGKRRPAILLLHIVLVAAASWVALGLPPQASLVLGIALSHLLIDAAKLRWGGPGFAAFALDQGAHLAVLAIGASYFPSTYASGLWPHASRVPEAMAVVAGLVATVWAGGHAVQALMAGIALPLDPDESLPQGGRLIGRLERLMIFMLVLAGQTSAIGFLIAAKSVLRFNELARDRDRRVSEYVIIGTLASFAWGIGVAYLTEFARAAVAAP